MSKGSDSVTASTRTFMTPKPASGAGPRSPKFTHLPKVTAKQLPWLIVAILLLFSLFLFTQYQQARHKSQSAGPNIVKQVGKLIILPSGETPTIITVKDAAKLHSEKFYQHAQNGDITLVYRQQQEAILYRPSANIIVNVAPVTVEPSGSSTAN